MVDVTSNPALMLNFKSDVADVPTIDLTGTEAMIIHPPLQGNIALDAEEDMNKPTAVLSHSGHSQGIHDESFSSMAPSLTGSTGAPAVPSTSVLQDIPTASLVIDKKAFSSKSRERVKALMLKENRTQTLIKVGMEEAATHYDMPASQDEERYDGDVSGEDEDAEVVTDEEDGTQIETLKSTENKTFQDDEGQEETYKEDGDQTAKSGDKKLVQKCSNWASSRS